LLFKVNILSNNYNWYLLATIWLLSMAANFIVAAPMPMTGLLISTLNLSHADAGLLIALSPLMYIVLSIPSGIIADRWSVRKIVGTGAILMAVGGILRGFASTTPTLFIFTIVAGSGVALTIPNLPKMIATWFPPGKIGLATGVYVTSFALSPAIVFAITPSLLLPVFDNWGNVFLVYGLFALLTAILWWIISRDSVKLTHKRQKIGLKFSVLNILKIRDLWFLGYITTTTNILWYSISSWLPFILISRGFDPVAAGLVVALYTLAGTPALIFFPVISDKIGLRKPFIWLPLLILGPIAYLLPFSHESNIWLISAIFGILVCSVFTLMFIVPIERVGIERAGSAMGFVLSIGYIGGLLGPWLVGYLSDLLNEFETSFLIIVVATEVAMILGIIIKETGSRQLLSR